MEIPDKDIKRLKDILLDTVDAMGENTNLSSKKGDLYWCFAGNIGKVKIDEESIDKAIDKWLKAVK